MPSMHLWFHGQWLPSLTSQQIQKDAIGSGHFDCGQQHVYDKSFFYHLSLHLNNWTNKSKEKSTVYCHMWEKWCILFQYSVRKSGKSIYYLYKCLFMFMDVKVMEMSWFSYLVYYVNYPNESVLSIYIFLKFG